MDVIVNQSAVELSVPSVRRSAEQLVLNGLLFVVTLATVAIGVFKHVPAAMTAVNAVAFGLTLVWAVTGVVAARFSERSSARVDWYALLIAVDALLAAIALTAGRYAQGENLHSYGAARSIATIAALLVTAVSFHFLLALPDGQLPGRGRRSAVIVVYVAALGSGLAFVITKESFSVLAGGISWSIAAVCALLPARLRYATSIGHERERLQWFAVGAVLAASIALVLAVLHVLIGWPGPLGAVAAGATALIPLSLMAGESRRLSHRARACSSVPSRCSGSSPWCRRSTSSWSWAWGTRRMTEQNGRRSGCPCWRRASPRWPSSRLGSGSSVRPPASSTEPGRRPTRCSEPSAAA
jgi:hypothetical protein